MTNTGAIANRSRHAPLGVPLDQEISESIQAFRRQLYALPELPRVSRILLYGSYARGDFGEESDVDLAVVFAGQPRDIEQRKRWFLALADPASAVLATTSVLISAVAIWENDLLQRNESSDRTFYRNVADEGIVVWAASA